MRATVTARRMKSSTTLGSRTSPTVRLPTCRSGRRSASSSPARSRRTSASRSRTVPLLELTDVEARYGPIRALHGITLNVGEGEIVAVLGANGAGKTTTLRAISGTVRRDGQIAFGGERIGRASPETITRKGIAHVPEGRGTFSQLTVAENLRLGAYIRRDRKSVAAETSKL